MPQQESEGAERTSVDVEELEETLRIVEQYSPQSPYFDNMHEHQEWAELKKVRDWAKKTRECGHSISEIRPNLDESENRDDPPDVLAEIDGKLVGIEVTDLVVYPKGHLICIRRADGKVACLRWRQRQNGTFEHCWRGAELDPDEKAKWERKVEANPDQHKDWVEWTLERFQMRLAEIVKTKDEKAGAKKARRMRRDGEDALDTRLHASFLLIFTPELYLQHHLAEYLAKTEVVRPENFDRVFVMGYAPRDGHPVFEVRLSRCIESLDYD